MPSEIQIEPWPASEPLVIDATAGLVVQGQFPWSRATATHDGNFTIYPAEIPCTDGLLIYVHGYNEDAAMAKAYGKGSIAKGYAESGGKQRSATFLWNSKFGLLGFGKSIQAADATAPVFAQAIEQVQSVCPEMRIHILAHSLGARVVLGALARFSVRVHDIGLVAPAVDEDALAAGGEFAAALRHANRFLITHNAADRSMLWYRTRGRRALGERGFVETSDLPSNVWMEDMTSAWSGHAQDGGHGAILHPLFWGGFWKRAAARGFFQ